MTRQEWFSKCMSMKTETLDISLPKPGADSLILQVNELHYDPEADQAFANWYVECEDALETISLISRMM